MISAHVCIGQVLHVGEHLLGVRVHLLLCFGFRLGLLVQILLVVALHMQWLTSHLLTCPKAIPDNLGLFLLL